MIMLCCPQPPSRSVALLRRLRLLMGLFGFDELAAGVFLGATIHNVAQVVGAGHMLSDAAGEAATLVKLLRVADPRRPDARQPLTRHLCN